YCSKKVETILGYSWEEMIGKTPFDFMSPDEAKRICEIFNEVVTNRKKIIDLENWNICKDGREICLLTNGVPIINKQGDLLGFRGVDKDITERKQANKRRRELEARLQQAQKMESLGTLAGGIAHDFNNILSGVFGYAQLAHHSAEGNLKVQQYTDQIVVAGQRAAGLVKQILSFSRQNAPERTPSDISIIVKEAVKLLRASIPSTIEMRQNIKSNVGTVCADQTQVHQIVMNLCTNAFHALKKDGGWISVQLMPVTIGADDTADFQDMRPGDYLELSVSDNGCGMDNQTRSRIFEPYFTTKGVGEGTGLGLATVHGIVKNHEGHIKVVSELGVGTSFHVFFPVVDEKEKIKTTDPPQSSMGNENILFVDDEKTLVDLGKSFLEIYGYNVETRISPHDALEAFRTRPDKYDIVVTDMTMPGMNGDKLSREIKAIRSDIPVVICTGFSLDISPNDFESMGVEGILMKPVPMKEMGAMVRSVLNKAKDLKFYSKFEREINQQESDEDATY
ncbi:MAG: ATP-binding protein, partial [Pseudomonadota bacterium]